MARVVKPAEARQLSLPGRLSREIVSGPLGADNVSFRLVEIAPLAPGATPRGPHVHHDFEECIYILSGSCTTECESGTFPLEAGDTILVPAGELHVTHVTGDTPVQLLCFFPVAEVGPGTTEFPNWDAARAAK